ncbi:MAG TPA: DNA repair protein RecO [Gammaproteobacteria bacterium]|nr:DNA repair protein RecO [Gammaproteobacteria bacterium]
MQRVSLQPGYVIHQRDFKDSSRIIECYTQDYGRVALVAKGVRSSKKGFQYLLQPFLPLKLSWAGRGELPTLTHVEMNAASSPHLQGKALFCGFYLNELIVRLTHRHDASPELYQCYLEALSTLDQPDQEEPTLRRFEVQMLDILGYGLQLEVDGNGEPIDPHQQYYYHVETGPMTTPIPGIQHIPTSGETLLALSAGLPLANEKQQQESRRLMRSVLQFHLGGKPLQSRRVYQQLFKS